MVYFASKLVWETSFLKLWVFFWIPRKSKDSQFTLFSLPTPFPLFLKTQNENRKTSEKEKESREEERKKRQRGKRERRGEKGKEPPMINSGNPGISGERVQRKDITQEKRGLYLENRSKERREREREKKKEARERKRVCV